MENIRKCALATAVAAATLSGPGNAHAQAAATRQEIASVVSRAAAEIDAKYVDASVARAMADTLRRKLARGGYAAVTELRALCDILSADVQRVSHDLHLRFVYSAEPRDVSREGAATDTAGEGAYMEQVRAEGLTRNFGFDQVARLPGNIGYVRLSTFFPLEHGRDVADAAMRFLASTDAIIVDLRGNSGGSPDMVGHLMRYFVTDTTVLGTVYDRLTDRTTTNRIVPIVGSVWYRAKPAYVLLDSTIFSAPEAFAYNLQSLGRVVVVGERTRGGAHVTTSWVIDPHVEIRIPHERGTNTRTGADWEGAGVVPQIPASRAMALIAAQIAALTRLLEQPSASELAEERKAALARLEGASRGRH